MSSQMQTVQPVNPVAPYQGGKRNLAKTVIERIEAVDHQIYAEPFVGMGGIFLRRKQRPKSEVINDWSDDVSNFFRVMQRHYVAFLDMVRFQITSRSNFEKLARAEARSLTDLERAARFLYLQRVAFGGKVRGRNFGVAPANGGRFDIAKLGPMLEALHERLSGVIIERLPWQEFIRRYDRDQGLFYLDPPYYGCENDYGRSMFEREEFEVMANTLAGLKSRFILSINDKPEVRAIFSAFDIEAVETTYTVGGGTNAAKFGELIIRN